MHEAVQQTGFLESSPRRTPGPPISLRPYQEEALAAILDGERRGVRRPVVVMPTGTGKTVLFSALVAGRMPGRSLVLAHRDELIRQAADKLRAVMPNVAIGIVKADEDQPYHPVVVASVQTLASAKRRLRLRGPWATVVIDEAHHAAAKTYRDVIEHLGAGEPDGPLLLGVTATPDRGDGVGLEGVFDEVVYQVDLLSMIAQGYLADLTALRVQVEDVDLDAIRSSRGDFDQGQMNRYLEDTEWANGTAQAIATYAPNRKTLVFCQSVALAQDTASELVNLGVRAESIDGAMGMEQRRSVLRRFGTGEIEVVCNCMVLTEGFDMPAIDCIAVARPTQSRSLYVQMVGRGMRPFPGKANCLILDIVGATQKYADQLQTVASLAGTSEFGKQPGEPGAERTLVETWRQMGGLVKDPVSGRLVAVSVQLFDRSRLAWVASGQGAWALSSGNGQLLLSPAAGKWRVSHVGRDETGTFRRIIADVPDLGYAQGLAEAEARKLGAGALLDRGANWRTQPASDKQIAALRSMRIRLSEVEVGGIVTKGAASDAITAAKARQAARGA